MSLMSVVIVLVIVGVVWLLQVFGLTNAGPHIGHP